MTMPLVRAPPDVLRHGWHKACDDAQSAHPVEEYAQQVRLNIDGIEAFLIVIAT